MRNVGSPKMLMNEVYYKNSGERFPRDILRNSYYIAYNKGMFARIMIYIEHCLVQFLLQNIWANFFP